MNLITTYLRALWLSISTVGFYRQVLLSPLKNTVFFTLTTLFFISLGSVVLTRIFFFPTAYEVARNESTRIVNELPDDFSLEYKEGIVQYYGVGLPFTIESSKDSSFLSKNLITLGDPEQKDAFLTLGSKDVTVRGPDDSMSTPSPVVYSEFLTEPFTKTKAQLQGDVNTLVARLPNLATMLSFFVVPLYWLYLLLSVGIKALFYALLLQTVAWVMGIRLRYIKSYQLGLQIAAIATLIDAIGGFIAPNFEYSLFAGSFLAMMMLILWDLRERRVE